jgi:hypothetical protein
VGFTGDHRIVGRETFRFYGERTPSRPGDFNVNCEVDAADYALWRNLHGQAVQIPNESGLVTGSVDIEDYWYWKANFGNSVPSIGSSTMIGEVLPEPGALVLAIIAMCAICAPRLAGCDTSTATPSRGALKAVARKLHC